ncbi:MAG: GNAT family N-acetyltransferase [Mycobacteriaceae bacterium]
MIRAVVPADVDAVAAMVHDLAVYEKAAQECHLSTTQLHAALFGENPALFGHVATDGNTDGTVVGFALWFLNFSTWDGEHGVYLEDLYVRPEHRGSYHGKALLATLAAVCAERGYSRLTWWVLNWNAPSIGFYRSLGAEAMDEWTTFRLSGDALTSLGALTGPAST